MSWSSDIRCLHCDGKLPLYRKITNGQFCCAAHRKLYWQEQERLGVERLHQTHDSLRAFRPPEGPEAILGRAMQENCPPASGLIAPSGPRPAGPSQSMRARSMPAESLLASPSCYEASLSPQAPLWAPQIAGALEEEIPIAGLIRAEAMPRPHWPMDQLEARPQALEGSVRVRMPLRAPAPLREGIATGKIVKIPVGSRDSRAERVAEPIPGALPICRNLTLAATPKGYPEVQSADDSVPRAESLVALQKFAARDSAAGQSHREAWAPAPFHAAQKAYLPLVAAPVAKPSRAGLRPLSIEQVPLVHGTWIDNLRALGSETDAPRYELSTPAMRPRLKLAAGSRYAVATRDAATPVASIEPKNLQPVNLVAIPERAAAAAASASGSAAVPMPSPGAAGPVPLASVTPSEPDSPQSVSSVNLPQPLRTQPMRPASHLEPLDAKPVADFLSAAPAPADAAQQPGAPEFLPEAPGDDRSMTPWMHVKGFWKYAPRDLKLLAFGIPILLALALQPSLKKVPYSAPPEVGGIQRGIQQNFETKLNEQWLNVRQTMVDRAAIALDEDFRGGLDDWTSRGGTTEWAFDATGFVRPGPLALYGPSLNLTDYQLQFLGMIDKKALSWVVRAADFDDYYVVKLVVLKPGPLPTIGITRYAVIHGVAQDRVDTPVFVDAREDMLYRVRMDIHGDTFALTVQGQMVDSWSEPRLRKGGVGFFTARGEDSRLRWVQVTHQYDMLGRLCAYLAPYNIPSAGGGWQP